MDVPAKHAVGAPVLVLVGWRWFPATITDVGRWSDHSGNSYPLYTVTFPKGDSIRCGHNSLQSKRNRKEH